MSKPLGDMCQKHIILSPWTFIAGGDGNGHIEFLMTTPDHHRFHSEQKPSSTTLEEFHVWAATHHTVHMAAESARVQLILEKNGVLPNSDEIKVRMEFNRGVQASVCLQVRKINMARRAIESALEHSSLPVMTRGTLSHALLELV